MLRHSDKGFTLLELMISMTILGIIVLIVFGATRLGHRSIEKAERATEFLERMRTALNIIDSQLKSQVPLTYEENGEKKLYFAGNKESIQFSSNYSVWSGQRGYVKVMYSIEQEQNGRQSLYVTENTISIENPRKTLLLSGLEGISFYYFYKDPLNEHGEWKEEWTETTTMPDRLALNIYDSSRKISMSMHIAVKNKPAQQVSAPIVPTNQKLNFPRQGRPVQR